MEVKSLTLHSRRRIKSRCRISDPKKQVDFVNRAVHEGQKLDDLPNGRLKDYLRYEAQGCVVRVYDGYIFLFGKNNKKLITVYPIPEEIKKGEYIYLW